MKHLRLNEVFPDWLSGGGVFHYIQNNNIPWSDPDISGVLDIAYHGDHGARLISPLVRKLLNEDNELTALNKQKLADVITTLFLPQWQRTYELLTLQYDPLNNYDMTETETYEGSNENEHRDTGTLGNAGTVGRTGTIGNTGTVEHAGSVGNEGTVGHAGSVGNTGTVTHTGTSTDETENTAEGGLYGFNSESAVDSDISTSEGGNTHTNNLTDTTNMTETRNLTDTTDMTETRDLTDTTNMTETHNLTDTTNMTETHNLTGTDAGSNTYERTLTRSGNIGVTTSQQMVQSQIDLWKWNFYRSVFKDIDSVLTLKIY